MPLPVLADTLRVNMVQNCFGLDVENVLHYTFDGGALDLGATCAVFGLAWFNNVQQHQTTEVNLGSVKITRLESTPEVYELDTHGAGWHGALSELTAPMNCASVIRFNTGHPGRSYRGRAYIGCRSVEALAALSTRWANSALTDYQNDWNAFNTEIATEIPDIGIQQVVYSAMHNTKALVTTVQAQPIIGTQRRRITAP